MAFEVSEIIDPVAASRYRSAFTERVSELPVGKAFIVTGMLQGNAGSRVAAIGKSCHPRRRFTTHKLNDGRIQITRIE